MARAIDRMVSLVALVTSLVASGLTLARPAEAQFINCPQNGAASRSRVSARPRYASHAPRVVTLPSRQDGTGIQIGILRPYVPQGTRVPVIVHASPYFPALRPANLEACADFFSTNFVPQGYAVALIAVRGSGDSGGCFELFGPRERADLDQAITWLGTRSWSNGAVGMIGLSYDGSTPWEVAAAGNPHLRTIVPIEGVPDAFNLMFGGGTPDWRGPGILNANYYAANIAFPLPQRRPKHTVEVAACPEYAIAEAASAYSYATGELDPFGYWADRRYIDDIFDRYHGSVFLVQGLQDWNVNPGSQFPLITDLQRRGVPTKMLLGQWPHAYPDEVDPPHRRPDWANMLLRWFDRWLRNMPTSVGPPVQVEDTDGRWRNEKAWPPSGASVRFSPSAPGALTTTPPSDSGTVVLALDPMHFQDPAAAQGAGVGEVPGLSRTVHPHCAQPVCAAFRTVPFSSAYRVAGIPKLRLSVVPLGPGGTVSAFLFADGPDGLQRIGWGQADLRFPKGPGAPQPVVPGRRITLDFSLQPLDAAVHAGEQLVLMISAGNTFNRLPSSAPAPVVVELGNRRDGLTITHPAPRPSQFFAPRKGG